MNVKMVELIRPTFFGISYDPGNGLWTDELKKLKKVDFFKLQKSNNVCIKIREIISFTMYKEEIISFTMYKEEIISFTMYKEEIAT